MEIFSNILFTLFILSFLLVIIEFFTTQSNKLWWRKWNQHKHNFPIEYKGKIIWYSRSVAAALFVFAKDLVEGTIKNLERIDNLIEKYSNNWDIKRIQYVDKSIIRMSIYSLIFLKDIPKSVVIDEAVEIAKIFSDKDSYKFVNGILDGIQENDIQ